MSNKINFEEDALDLNELNLDFRDYASFVLPDLDFESQLIAIRHQLKTHKTSDEELAQEIKDIEKYAKSHSGYRNQKAVDDWVDRLHSSVYQSAAHSMAAVGMLAPFIESLFFQSFMGMKDFFSKGEVACNTHIRWDQSKTDGWDCHYVWGNNSRKRDLVKGIIQLSEATGLTKYLPDDLERTLTILFSYRNKMFHFGFE